MMVKKDYKSEIESLEATIRQLDDLRREKRFNEVKQIESEQCQRINKLVDEEIIPDLPEKMKEVFFPVNKLTKIISKIKGNPS